MAGNSAIETGASSGVNELLARLREEGVSAGRKEALELVRAYYAIPENQRRRLFDLARVLSDAA